VDRCKEKGVIIVRRTSGGGTIFTDKGQLIYGLITKKRIGSGIADTFKMICEAIVKTLAEFDVKAEYKPPNDIVLNGKKISGNAQSLKDKAFLIHGTIILDIDTELMDYVLKNKKPGYVSSIKRECGCDLDLGELKSKLSESFKYVLDEETIKGEFTGIERNSIDRLISERYAKDDWNFKR
jgi:lipoate---protein ligase